MGQGMSPSSHPAPELRTRLLRLLRAQEKKRGFLIAFEGPEGAGKTTQRKLFKQWLRCEGYKVQVIKWSSSPLLKPLIKARKKAHSFSPEEFCLLHAADFRYQLENVILPALWEGRVVVADRYLFTGLAQDAARGLEFDWLLHIYRPLIWPDAVFYFSVSPLTSTRRLGTRKVPKFYDAGQDITEVEDPFESYRIFARRLIQEYEAQAIIFSFGKVDAEKSIYEQHKQIRKLFEESRRRPWVEWDREAILEWLAGRVSPSEVSRAR